MGLCKFLLLACPLLILTSCASEKLHSFKAPGADLNITRSVYVKTIPGDKFSIDRMIAEQLIKMGYKATYGPASTPPEPVDVIVTYEDRWMWDMTMYLLKLSIKVYDGATNKFLAAAESYQTSLVRKSSEEVVEAVLSEIFQKKL